jgi:hypothetical protein
MPIERAPTPHNENGYCELSQAGLRFNETRINRRFRWRVAIFLQRTGIATLFYAFELVSSIPKPGDWMDYVACQERDRIILAFVLAVNAQNNVVSSLEAVADDDERHRAIASAEAGRGHCHELRDRLLLHCQNHGC